MKIALVHDYLKEYGGAERVLHTLHEIWPEAPIYTIFCIKDSPAGKSFEDAEIRESWFRKLPFCEKLISPFRFLLPAIWGSFNFSQYDLVISSASWAVTKGFSGPNTKEICYCHTPPRYLYGYETSRDWKKNFLVRLYGTLVNHFMRMYDYEQAQKVNFFIANSREVQQRIKKFYQRESVVINPPVEVKRLTANGLRQMAKSSQPYFLAGGRLELPKNFDLIIKACREVGVPLKIYGTGSRLKYLKLIAGPKVEFLGRISDKERQELMADCRAFIVAAEDEDFGITPVETMATGRPVIAFRGGGYLETVVEGKTGVFFDEPTVAGLVKVLREFDGIEGKIKPEDCRKQAEKFDKQQFVNQFREFVDKATNRKHATLEAQSRN